MLCTICIGITIAVLVVLLYPAAVAICIIRDRIRHRRAAINYRKQISSRR